MSLEGAIRTASAPRPRPPGRRALEPLARTWWEPERKKLALALVLALAGIAAFVQIAEDYLTNDPLARWDVSFARWLAGHRSTAGLDFFRVVTAIGSPVSGVLLGAVVCVVLYRRRRLADAALVPLVLAGAELANFVLKLSFHRARPEVGFVQLDTYSFPSGHAMISTAVWGMFAFLAWGRSSRKALLLLGTVVLVALIGFSRLYLGVHYLSDVLAGVAGGVAWLGISFAVHAHWAAPFAHAFDGSGADRRARRLTRS